MPIVRPSPAVLEGYGVRLEPLDRHHAGGLAGAATDGALWSLWYTFVPHPESLDAYVANALDEQAAGHMLPWAVRELHTDEIVGCTRYHDIDAGVGRVEIGYTWYARSWHRTFVNTACKLLQLEHAFERLGCGVVGFRTDSFNFTSQRAIAALGAHHDGTIRRHQLRRDGTVRDTVMYSILAEEWPDVRRHLVGRLQRHGGPDGGRGAAGEADDQAIPD